jgi:predicted nucleotidyltransferase
MKTNNIQKEAILTLLQNNQSALKQFGVARLAIFGSMVRGEATDNSDIDILVSFEKTPTSKEYFGLQFFLEDLLEKPIDLVTDKALRKELRPYIENELIYVA